MPMWKIKESATGQIDERSGIIVPVMPEAEHDDGTVSVRVQGCGVVLRDGDLVRVPKTALQHVSQY